MDFLLLLVLANSQPPNETVEKTKFTDRIAERISVKCRIFRGQGQNGPNGFRIGLCQRPEDVDLADIVYQSEQAPLYIHFTFGTQGESVHVFMYTDVRKDRFHYP